jgi:hypothetical protein
MPIISANNALSSSSSSSSASGSQTPSSRPTFIDLTCDPDSPPSLPPPPPRLPSVDSDLRRRPRRAADRIEMQTRNSPRPRGTQNSRPPRFGRNIMSGTPELIDLSTVSDEIEDSPEPAYSRRLPPPVPPLPVDSSTGSSEVEFISSRPIPPNAETAHVNNGPQAPASSAFQPFAQSFSHLRDLLAAGTSFMNSTGRYGQVRAGTSRANQDRDRLLEEEQVQWIARAVGNHHRGQTRPHRFPDLITHAPPTEENFDIGLDYVQQAFPLGGIIEGVAGSSTPDRRPSPPYKAPPAAAEGFTRKVEEDDVVVCVNCGDELGAGDGEVKRQVWVTKTCGHVCKPPYTGLMMRKLMLSF